MSNPRGLSEDFIEALRKGVLSKLLEKIKCDHTLDLQIRRDDEVNVYYRGGRIIGIKMPSKVPAEFQFVFDLEYVKCGVTKEVMMNLPSKVNSESQVEAWVKILPCLKECMDFHRATFKEANEREFQQLFVRENNYSNVANGTDYFFVDMEYVHPLLKCGQSDLIAFKWRSHERRKGEVSLAFIEAKFGDKAYKGDSGIVAHVQNLCTLVNDENALQTTKTEMLEIFRQKRRLDLVRFGKNGNENEVISITKEIPEIILVLINHDPESIELISALDNLVEPERRFVKIATSNFFGYGLYENCVLSLDDFLGKFNNQVYSKERKK